MNDCIELLDVGAFRICYYNSTLSVDVYHHVQHTLDVFCDKHTKRSFAFFYDEYLTSLEQFKMLAFDEMLKESLKTRYNMCLDHTVSIYGDDILKVVNYV